MGLGMTAHAVQQMGLFSATERLNARNAQTICSCAKFLKRLPTTRTSTHTPKEGALCTWRPDPVLDLFILLSPDPLQVVIGISMYNEQGDCTSVEYFKPSNVACEGVCTAHDVVLLAQMTFDYVEATASFDPMLLVYDAFDPVRPLLDAYKRYTLLQSKSHEINAMRIGNARCFVQWAGAAECSDQILNMKLPHNTSGLLHIQPHLSHVLSTH